MKFLRHYTWQMALLVALILLVGSLLIGITGKVGDRTAQIDTNVTNIEKNCDLLARTNDKVREQFRLALTDDITRVRNFIKSGGAATPAAANDLRRSLGKMIARRSGLPEDFPNLKCP